jgi:hypothetical protein
VLEETTVRRSVQHPSSDLAEPVLGIAEGNIRGLGHLLPQGEKAGASSPRPQILIPRISDNCVTHAVEVFKHIRVPEPQATGRPTNFTRHCHRDKKSVMTKLEKIEETVASLSDDEMKRFAAWFDELRWERWDRQFEADVKAGKLDKLADQALADHDAGRTRPL